MPNRSHLWLVFALSLPIGCQDSSSSTATTDATTADSTDAADAADATDGVDATDGADATDATEATDGADATDGVDVKQPCGWDAGLARYQCGESGEDPMFPIDCPDNVLDGDACDISGVTRNGCCDANGDAWHCESEAVILINQCNPG